MSDQYELFKKEPCAQRKDPCSDPRCDGCAGDGSRRVPTGRIVKVSPFVWSDTEDAFYDPPPPLQPDEQTVFVEVTDDAE